MRTSVNSESDQLMPDETVPTLYCAYHPGRETVLRCNRCDKPICYECAVRTPVGYRCKDCVRQQQSVYFNANRLDPVVAGVVAVVLGAVAGVVAIILSGILGFFGFLAALFAGPVAGGIVAEAVRWSVRRRRARHLNLVVVIATAFGMLLGGLVFGPLRIASLSVLLFAALALSAVYARLQ